VNTFIIAENQKGERVNYEKIDKKDMWRYAKILVGVRYDFMRMAGVCGVFIDDLRRDFIRFVSWQRRDGKIDFYGYAIAGERRDFVVYVAGKCERFHVFLSIFVFTEEDRA
jgi:hypothetical protein